jgi:hypothetical protein
VILISVDIVESCRYKNRCVPPPLTAGKNCYSIFLI